MAMYEYRCEDCEKTFTVNRSISEHEKKKRSPECPHCGERKARRLYSGFFAKTSSKT